jgi:hypothetical protein
MLAKLQAMKQATKHAAAILVCASKCKFDGPESGLPIVLKAADEEAEPQTLPILLERVSEKASSG